MKNLRVIILIALLATCSYSRLIAAESDIRYTIANDVASSNWLEFDLLLFDPDPSQDFQLTTVQAGIYLDPACFTGLTVTAQILSGTSMLNSSQVPSSITFTASANCIKLAAKAPPGCGSGTIISKDPQNPTRICRIRLNVISSWIPCSPANLNFIFTTTPYPTKIAYYDAAGCTSTAVTTGPSNCYSNAANQVLYYILQNPAVFNVTGGGSYCAGGSGLPVGLSGSEIDVNYELYKDGITQNSWVNGTGMAISFGLKQAGNYTIKGYRNGCIGMPALFAFMSGSAIIVQDIPTVGGLVAGPDSAVEGVTLITMTLGGQTGSVVHWQKRLGSGGWTEISSTATTYSEIPSSTGIWEYRALVQNGNCQSTYSGSHQVFVKSRYLTIKLFLEGLYRESTGLMDKARDENGEHFPGETADLVNLSLAQGSFPYSILYSLNNVSLPRNGLLTVELPSGYNLSYYLVINHRNSVETWSSFPVNFNNENTVFNFTNGVYKAYGYNMMQMGSVWVFFTGDVNQDGIIDSGDMIPTENQVSLFTTGYVVEDTNGDGLVDSSDMSMIGNHSAQFIGKVTP